MNNWKNIANDEVISATIEALKKNGIDAEVVVTGQEAKEKVFSLVPPGAEVMNMTSVTLDSIGVASEIAESGKYNSVRKKLMSMDRKTQSLQMQKLGAAPEYTVASVHAVTEEGHIFIASNTGSQLPADAYGSAHVIFVVGAQKIVKDNDEAFKRIYEYVLPLESERANQQYNMTHGSFVSKLLIINRELVPDRIKVIFVKEVLGF